MCMVWGGSHNLSKRKAMPTRIVFVNKINIILLLTKTFEIAQEPFFGHFQITFILFPSMSCDTTLYVKGDLSLLYY